MTRLSLSGARPGQCVGYARRAQTSGSSSQNSRRVFDISVLKLRWVVTEPLLTLKVHDALLAAARAGAATVECSLDLERTTVTVQVDADGWSFAARRFPYLQRCKDRTIYHWTGSEFAPVSRFTTSLIKLVPTDWGPPTFEIDGIKMLPTAHVSPYADAERKVALIRAARQEDPRHVRRSRLLRGMVLAT